MNQKTTVFPIIAALLCLSFFNNSIRAQNFGTVASAVWLTDCNQSNYFNTSGTAANEIGPAANVFSNAGLGVHTQNAGTLILRGAELRTFKNAGLANVCSARLYYRVYLQTAVPGAFNIMDLPKMDDCDAPSAQYPSGGNCQPGDQKWNRVIPDGVTIPYPPVNLTSQAPGNYVLEVYYDISGSSASTTLCDETILLNNGGANYKAFFSIQAPVLASNNPTTCNGTEGSITISGLVAGATYTITYTDDGVPAGPVDLVANGTGQVVLSGLNAGVYSNFELLINGCTTNLFTGIILSNPVFTPTFTKIGPFCAGSTVPSLPLLSNNGINGTWSPAVINNQASGFYTFTPTGGQCGLPITLSVTITANITPVFSFGTVRTICAGGVVPSLPAISNNGISGVWNPSVVSNQNSGVYTFTPNPGPCTVPTTFTVNVTPNVTPTFDFGTSMTICEGDGVPALPVLSVNGITGTWTPAVVSNSASGTYTFTPVTGQCAVPATFAVTVTPKVTPVFSFGSSLSVCENATVPALPATSDNGISGNWNPATVSDKSSGTYTFTPSAGQCANNTTFDVTVTPNITPVFSFGTTQTICAGGTVPVLPAVSTNGISGSWHPAVVDNQNSASYAFTPDPGSCVTGTTFTLLVTPNITPVFSFGTALSICAGEAVPTLPNVSGNGINGTWSPATVDNQSSGVYTFTPTAGVCAIPTTFSVTVTPNTTPVFSFGTSLTICANGIVPALPTTADNGITGTWNPGVVNNQASGVYTFTPTAGQCAIPTTFSVTVTPNITPTFSFGTAQTICAGGTVPALPGVSTNGINGTWNPAVADNQNSGSYTFTPDPGSCVTTTTFNLTVTPNVTPTFSFGTAQTICAGAAVPTLPGLSGNGITGTWNPAVVDDQASGVYTFTPAAGLCALPTTFNVTVTPNVIPLFSFGTALTICENGTVPLLPAISDNGITGTWNPAVVNNQASGNYIFTPTAGLCATPITFAVTVTPNILPVFSFGTTLSICEGGIVPVLPATSTNGIDGTWSPAIADNLNSGVYTFTPAAGLCAVPTTFSVTVAPNITPVFSFGTSLSICAGGTVPVLPASSVNGITGTWNPAVADNQNSGVYTFTPTVGLCALPTNFTITVAPNPVPVFSFGTTLSICAGATVPVLPAVSSNGITGSWNPAVVSDQTSGTYTFTPSAGTCAVPASFDVTVTPNITPTFDFGVSLSICDGGSVPALPTTSVNGVTGTWSPSIIDNQNSAVYTFTPTAGLCAVTSSLSVTVNPIVTPVFDFGTTLTICSGDTPPVLPLTSINGITGTWDPAVVDNQASGVYTFTPAAGQCAIPTIFTVTVTPSVIPVFSLGSTLTICTGGTAPALPATSVNGINGTWNPAVINNQASGVYTFTPTATPDQCIRTASITVTVKPILTPQFSFGTTLTVCAGSTVPVLPTTSANDINGTWSPSTINNEVSGIYTFTTTPGQCATASAKLTVTVNPVPTSGESADTIVNDGTAIPANQFQGSPAGVNFVWTNTNPSIGLPASGSGDVPPFTATNRGNDPISGTITMTPVLNGCAGADQAYTITVKPLNKDVFVPNVFSPNGDGKNDLLFVYGNYITKLEMRIFNQWGEQIELLNNTTRGWNGTYRGKPQPVGVYVYTLQAELSDGRTVKMKGSVTLLR